MKKIIKIALLALIPIISGCDREDFADLNTDPSIISNPDLRFSMTKAVEQMYGNDYTVWFYSNFQYTYPWTQVMTTQGGNSSNYNLMGAYGNQNIYKALFPQTIDIRYRIDQMDRSSGDTYQALRAITYPIQILPALANSDLTGSIVYSQAGLAPYTNPPLLTPVFDNQETLFTTWLHELDSSITVLRTSQNQLSLGTQDVIYGGDYNRWAKLCNLLKLKIATRLINVDRAKAFKIAEEVAASPAGYPDNLTDDFIYNRGVKYYGTGDAMWIGWGNKKLIDFMFNMRDPRMRFIFEKNDFNAEVIQAFIDTKTKLPPFVEQYVNYDGSGNFAGWKSPGEPWVRYQGVPISPDASFDSKNDIYFNQEVLNSISLNGVKKTYYSTSEFSEKQVRTTYNYTYPTKPGGRVIELKDNDPPLNVILASSAEANLYLAEFKLLGANLPKSAQDYMNRGVEFSVRRMDALAKNNQMPYYNNDPVYLDPTDAENASTKLRDGEVTALLSNPAINVSTDGLEKVYLQQYINFMITPNDLWAVVRRSGVPKANSTYMPWEKVTMGGVEAVIPRRFVINTVTKDDINYNNKEAAIKEQGFTEGTNNPQELSTQRLWYDKNNPDYGTGPK